MPAQKKPIMIGAHRPAKLNARSTIRRSGLYDFARQFNAAVDARFPGLAHPRIFQPKH